MHHKGSDASREDSEESSQQRLQKWLPSCLDGPMKKKVFLFISTLQSPECAPPSSSLSVWRQAVTVRCSSPDCFHSLQPCSPLIQISPQTLFSRCSVSGALSMAIKMHTIARLLFTWTWSDKHWNRAASDETPLLRRYKTILKVASYVVTITKKVPVRVVSL